MTKPQKVIQPATNPNHLYETVKTIIVAALFALALRSIAFEPFVIPSGSMVPTLLVGDYLFVSKYAYGYSKYSFPLGIFPVPNTRIMARQPERGDVIVFRKPHNEQIDYIKRLIGLPGDKIQMRKGRLYINGKMVEREFIGTYEAFMDGMYVMHKRYWETLPGGKKHLIIERNDNSRLDNTPLYTVPQGRYFMMGDNRDGSQDSRVLEQVGFVPYENLVGRANYIFFSVDENSKAWEFWRWPWTVRFDRLVNKIN